MKISEVIEKVKEFHKPYEEREKTRDLVLYGNPDVECTGVAVTADATLEVIRKCHDLGLNLIISHEGIFYNFEKGGNILEKDNSVLKEKIKYLEETGIVVWRDHDHMHGDGPFKKNPDGTFEKQERKRADQIYYGTMVELGWQDYVIGDKLKPLWYKIPKTSARELGQFFIEKFGVTGMRIVGNLDAEIETVFICEHVNGGERDLPIIDSCEKADAIIPLEICDYTVTTYVRDAAILGKNKVIFELGHFTAEELGMKYLEKVLPEVIGLPVKFVKAADTFSYLLKK